MTSSTAFLHSVILQALVISCALSALLTKTEAADIDVKAVCPSFSCGHLQDIQHPFRLQGDPPNCGVQEYELVCSDNLAIIHINSGRYFVTNISYSDSIFWVVDASLDNSSCPVPERNQLPYINGLQSANMTLFYVDTGKWAAFVSCSQMIRENDMYRPVVCQSTNTLLFVLNTMPLWVQNVQPSCGYLAMTPLGRWHVTATTDASYDYEDIVKFMRTGFAVNFPLRLEDRAWTYSGIINRCVNDSVSNFHEQMSSSSIQNQTLAIVGVDMKFLICVNDCSYRSKLFWASLVVVSAISIVKFIIVVAVVSRLLSAPLSVLTFLAYKYWKTKISIDAVEKLLV